MDSKEEARKFIRSAKVEFRETTKELKAVRYVKTEPSEADRKATQKFEIRSILIGHCGEKLAPDNIDSIAEEMFNAISTGPCSWAFNPKGTS